MPSAPSTGPGIEFVLIGPAKAGKSTAAQRLARRFHGACFNLSVYNRLIAWWILRRREQGVSIDVSDQAGFSGTLAHLSADTVFERDGRVLHRGIDISDELETSAVSLQASEQSAVVYRCYRSQLNPIVWKAVATLKREGPVFLVARRQSSVFSARRAVYLDASRAVRTQRLRASEPTMAASEAAGWILQRDLGERTFLEKDACDALIDSSDQSIEETVDAVAREYQKARVVANVDFYGLRPLVAMDRIDGEQLLAQWLQQGRRFLLCCADLDHQGKYKNAFGKQVDLLSHFLAQLSEAADDEGGVPIIWGSDDILLLFPFEQGGPREALTRLDRVRKAYWSNNAGKLGVGVITARNGEPTPPSWPEVSVLGEFTGRFAGEELFPFEVRRGTSVEQAFADELAYLNGRLAHTGVHLAGHEKCLVPPSTATLGGVLVESTRVKLGPADLVDAAYGAMQDAKARGRNRSYLFELDELSSAYRFAGQPLLADQAVLGEISRRPSRGYPVPRQERREHYPFFHKITSLERLVSVWLKRSTAPARWVLLLYPGFSGRPVVEALVSLAAQGEVPADATTQWVLPHGFWFKALARVYSQQNRDILIRTSAHAFRVAVAHWVRCSNAGRSSGQRLRMASVDGRLLRGLRLAIECFWFFEGPCQDADVLGLLRAAQLELARRVPSLDVRVLGLAARLDGVSKARDVFRQVDVFRDCVMDPRRHTADEHGNILVGIEISPEDPQRTEDREESSQEQNLEDLRDVTVAAAGALAFACFEREFWRGQRELAGALGGDHPDAAVHALSLMRAAKRLESWPPSDLAGLVRFLVHRQGGVGMELARVLHACGAHVLDAYLHESAWLDAKQDSDVVPAADMPETEHTLELVARFLSGEGLALLDGDAVVEPIGSDALQTVFCRIFEQAPEIPQIVWRDEAPNWVHRLARPDER